MRILASLILFATVALASPATAATAASEPNQNSKQILEIKKDKINSLADNFLLAMYIPKPENISLSRKIGNSLFSGKTILPSGSFVANASAYTAAADECGKADGITASGRRVEANRTLACPKQYKFGTMIEIEGMGTYVCEDRGGAIKGNHFDIYMPTKKEAFAFGRRNLIATVVD